MTKTDTRTRSTRDAHDTPSRKAYREPSLIQYGRMRDMTASGTMGDMENPAMMGPTFKP